MMQATAVLGFPEYKEPALNLAGCLGIDYLEAEIHQFPDLENKVKLPVPLAKHLIVCRSLNNPNSKLIELLFIAKTARQLGVEQLTLVAPYLCYMRQDMAFHEGEVISQTIIGEFLAQLFDRVITVDPHLHRIDNLAQAIPNIQAISLMATQQLGEFLAAQNKNYFLIGPDEESEQWVTAIAKTGGYDFAIARKTRHSDRHVSISLPEVDIRQRDIVLVDDMISTGHTMIETAKQLLAQGASSISCLVTHPLFSEDAMQLMQQNGIETIWSSDTIPHSTNHVSLTQLLADSLRPVLD